MKAAEMGTGEPPRKRKRRMVAEQNPLDAIINPVRDAPDEVRGIAGPPDVPVLVTSTRDHPQPPKRRRRGLLAE